MKFLCFKRNYRITDTSFELPLLGMKQSLNVSAAHGVAVYEMQGGS
ncbi:MAG: hypothetical protein IPL53_20970 [Ignavibacteria bacterium]|nr:hypothetical protein [Ignavibacteria bacterium]